VTSWYEWIGHYGSLHNIAGNLWQRIFASYSSLAPQAVKPRAALWPLDGLQNGTF